MKKTFEIYKFTSVKLKPAIGQDWTLLTDPEIHCYKKLKGRFLYPEAERYCNIENANVALPKNERENEFLVRLMGGAKGAWIDAIRIKDKLVSRDKQVRLKFTRLSNRINKFEI